MLLCDLKRNVGWVILLTLHVSVSLNYNNDCNSSIIFEQITTYLFAIILLTRQFPSLCTVTNSKSKESLKCNNLFHRSRKSRTFSTSCLRSAVPIPSIFSWASSNKSSTFSLKSGKTCIKWGIGSKFLFLWNWETNVWLIISNCLRSNWL